MAVTDKSARMRMISTLLAGFPSSNSGISQFTVDAYILVLMEIPTDIVGKACRSLMEDNPPRQFAPSASELRSRALLLMPPEPREELIPYPIGQLPPEGMVPAGIISIDHGYGRINMTKLSYSEQAEALKGTRRSPRRLGYSAGDREGNDS